MMRRLLTCLSLLWVFAAGPGCSGSDAEPLILDEDFYRLQECAGDGLDHAGGVFEALLDLIDAVADPDSEPPGHVIYHPDTHEFFVGADLDGDDFTEAVVEGTLTTTFELSDGLQTGESVSADWDIGAGVAVAGSGHFEVEMLSSTAVRILGTMAVSDSGGCDFTIQALDFEIETAEGPDVIPTGSIDFEVTSAPDSMTARIEFDGTRYASVTAQYRGSPVSYTLDLETGEVIG